MSKPTHPPHSCLRNRDVSKYLPLLLALLPFLPFHCAPPDAETEEQKSHYTWLKEIGRPFELFGPNYVSYSRGEFPVAVSWKPAADAQTAAITGAEITEAKAFAGRGALKLSVRLSAKEPRYRNGEVAINLFEQPPAAADGRCLPPPYNLLGTTITAQVLAPLDARGAANAPNGYQLFAVDQNWRRFYGGWTNMVPSESDWQQLSLTLDTVAAPAGYMEEGFDPTHIRTLGLKAGVNEAWGGTFEGDIFLDQVAWGSGNQLRYGFERTESPPDLIQSFAGDVALAVIWYMDGATASVVSPDSARTQSEEDVIRTIQAFRQRGLRVMLKLHVNLQDGSWHGDIRPADPEQWFGSYREFVLRYARIAKEQQAELFCLGTELNSLDTGYLSNWTELIGDVRQAYSIGRLTYAADWGSFASVAFLDQLDLVGVNAFFPLSDLPDPSLDTLMAGWQPWKEELAIRQQQIGKPFIFTEIGYSSRDYAAEQPWVGCSAGETCGHPYNCEVQRRCYEAAAATFSGLDWFKGMYFWYWSPVVGAGGCCGGGFLLPGL